MVKEHRSVIEDEIMVMFKQVAGIIFVAISCGTLHATPEWLTKWRDPYSACNETLERCDGWAHSQQALFKSIQTFHLEKDTPQGKSPEDIIKDTYGEIEKLYSQTQVCINKSETEVEATIDAMIKKVSLTATALGALTALVCTHYQYGITSLQCPVNMLITGVGFGSAAWFHGNVHKYFSLANFYRRKNEKLSYQNTKCRDYACLYTVQQQERFKQTKKQYDNVKNRAASKEKELRKLQKKHNKALDKIDKLQEQIFLLDPEFFEKNKAAQEAQQKEATPD